MNVSCPLWSSQVQDHLSRLVLGTSKMSATAKQAVVEVATSAEHT